MKLFKFKLELSAEERKLFSVLVMQLRRTLDRNLENVSEEASKEGELQAFELPKSVRYGIVGSFIHFHTPGGWPKQVWF